MSAHMTNLIEAVPREIGHFVFRIIMLFQCLSIGMRSDAILSAMAARTAGQSRGENKL